LFGHDQVIAVGGVFVAHVVHDFFDEEYAPSAVIFCAFFEVGEGVWFWVVEGVVGGAVVHDDDSHLVGALFDDNIDNFVGSGFAVAVFDDISDGFIDGEFAVIDAAHVHADAFDDLHDPATGVRDLLDDTGD
jgi:hypothetical protein